METAQQKANIKAGTTEVKTIDLLKMVGHLAKDQLSRVRVPALIFTFPLEVMRNYWGAFWDGRTLPFRFKINDEIQKDIFIGRLSFAVTFIISDSVWLVGKFGIWILKKIPWKFWNVVLVSGLVVGFLGWVFPWWLEEMNFMDGIKETKTMEAIEDIKLDVPQVPDLKLGWLATIPMIGMVVAAPFSVVRFKKWQGFKAVLRKKSKPIIGEDENPIS